MRHSPGRLGEEGILGRKAGVKRQGWRTDEKATVASRKETARARQSQQEGEQETGLRHLCRRTERRGWLWGRSKASRVMFGPLASGKLMLTTRGKRGNSA